jgi:hypothetical protein
MSKLAYTHPTFSKMGTDSLSTGRKSATNIECRNAECLELTSMSSVGLELMLRHKGKYTFLHFTNMPRLKIYGAIPPLPIYLHGVMLS